MSFLKLIRFPNLLIVIFTQYLLEYYILLPFLNRYEVEPMLDPPHFGLLVLVTVIIAAAGYVVNDIYDVPIDRLNKPGKVMVGQTYSVRTAETIFWALTIMGAAIALYLALKINRISWFLIYPVSVGFLFLYARVLKKTTVVGNLIVAAFCAGVAGIVLFPELQHFGVEDLTMESVAVLLVFTGYIFFAFFTTMYREVIKDLEDVEGDEAFGCRTLPVVAGTAFAKIFAGVWAGVLLLTLLALTPYVWNWNNLVFWCLILGVIFPVTWSLFKLVHADKSSDFHFISQLIKVVMGIGLLLLILISKSI